MPPVGLERARVVSAISDWRSRERRCFWVWVKRERGIGVDVEVEDLGDMMIDLIGGSGV